MWFRVLFPAVALALALILDYTILEEYSVPGTRYYVSGITRIVIVVEEIRTTNVIPYVSFVTPYHY